MGKARNGGRATLTQEGDPTGVLQSGQAGCYLVVDMQRLRSETRDGVAMRTEVGSLPSKRGDVREVRTFKECWTTSPTVSVTRGRESGMHTLCILITPYGQP